MLPSTINKKKAKRKNKKLRNIFTKSNYVIDLCNSFFFHVFCSIIFHNVPYLSGTKTGGNIVRTVHTVTPPPITATFVWRHLVVIIIIINCQQPVNTISIQLISIRFAVLDNKSKKSQTTKTGLASCPHIVSHNHES